MRVFVTGSTGVLGHRVVDRLVADGHVVTAVTRRDPAVTRARGATPVEVDLFDASAVRDAVAGHEAVLDLATSIPSMWRMARASAWRTNDRLRSEASVHAADAAVAAGACYVRESIGYVYADGGPAWLDEGAPLDVLAAQRSVVDAEAAAARVTDAGGVGIALRFGELYGSDSGHTRDALALARHGIAAVLGPDDAYLPRIHLDDAAAATVAALDAAPGVYNVVDDDPVTRGEARRIMALTAGRRLVSPPNLLAVGPARAITRSLRLSNGRLRAATGWAPSHASLRDGWPAVAAEDRERVDA